MLLSLLLLFCVMLMESALSFSGMGRFRSTFDIVDDDDDPITIVVLFCSAIVKRLELEADGAL